MTSKLLQENNDFLLQETGDFILLETTSSDYPITAGTTQTVTTFTVSGTAGNLITINSTTTATHALTKSGGGTITCNYLSVQHSVATPSNTWYALNSTNNQGVATAGSGWLFSLGVNSGF